MKKIKPAGYSPSNTESLRILNLSDTKHKVSMGKTLIYRLIKSGEFPQPVPLTKNRTRVGWMEAEVDAFILNCAASRKNQEAK